MSSQNVDFYSTAAQVLPVIFLTLVLELRFLDAEDQENGRSGLFKADSLWDLVAVTLVTFLLVGGEGLALAATSSGHPSHLERVGVVSAMAFGLASLITRIVVPWTTQSIKKLDGAPKIAARAVGYFQVLVPYGLAVYVIAKEL